MKSLFLIALCNLLVISGFSQVHVNGYYRSNGTYVQPYYRSSPDGNPYNNYSFPGNVNPYTGKVATGNQDTYLYHYYNRSTYTTPQTSYTSPTYYPTTTYYPPTTSYSRTNIYSTSSTSSAAQVTAEKLNVRMAPRSTSMVITTLSYGDGVTIINRYSAPWYYVTFSYYDPLLQYYRTTSGFIHSSYLSYSTESTSSSSAYSDYQTSSSSYTGTSYSSYPTSSNSYSGTLSSNNQTFSGYSPDPRPSPTPYDPSGVIYFVTTADLNVLSSPYANATKITRLTFKDGVHVLSTAHSPWYQVQISYLDESGYIRNTSTAYVYGPNLSRIAPNFVQSEQTSAVISSQYAASQPYGLNNGKLNFWSNLRDEDIAVYVDHVYKGQLTTYFPSQPNSCGGAGVISIIDTGEKHLVQAIGKKFHWSGYITIYADQCQMMGMGKELN